MTDQNVVETPEQPIEIYSKEQIVEFAAAVKKAVSDSAEATMVKVTELINNLEPADTGGTDGDTGTPPAGAGGMYLDDDREIKTKEVFVDLNLQGYGSYINIDIPANSIVSVTIMAVQMAADNINVGSYYTDQTQDYGWAFGYSVSSNADLLSSVLHIKHKQNPNYKKVRGLITYLA